MFSVTCPCGVAFESPRSSARWHSAACRKSFQRAAARRGVSVDELAGEPPASDEPPMVVDDSHELVRAVRGELEDAGRVTCVDGQVALELARRLANPSETSPSSLAKALRASLDAALGLQPVAAGAEPAADDDEVTRARKARADAREAAGLA